MTIYKKIFFILNIFLSLLILSDVDVVKAGNADSSCINQRPGDGTPWLCGGVWNEVCGESRYCWSTWCGDPVANFVCTSGGGCTTSCGDDNDGGGKGPDADQIYVRAYSRLVDTFKFWGPINPDSAITVNSNDNWRDYDFTVSASGPMTTDQIWAGRMCGRGLPYNINPDGTIQYKSNQGGETCKVSSFCDVESQSCNDGNSSPDKTWCARDIDGCGQSAWFSGDITSSKELASVESNRTHCKEDVENDSQPDLQNQVLCQINDLMGYITSPAFRNTYPTTLYPDFRFNDRYTFNVLAYENNDATVNVYAPGSFYCGNAVRIQRSDDSGETVSIKSPVFPPTATDKRNCSYTTSPAGGNTALMVEMKKAVIGRVVGLSSTNTIAEGLSGVTVRLSARTSGSAPFTLIIDKQTDANGYYRFEDDRLTDDNHRFYKVEVISSPPSGYTGSAYAINPADPGAASGTEIPVTWDVSKNRFTRVGETSYDFQATYWNNDCSSSNTDWNLSAGRCTFAFRQGPPNTPPTCSLQYLNSSGSYVSYDNNLVWNTNSDIRMRIAMQDADGDPLVSFMGPTLSCGTTSLLFPFGDFNYRTPSTASTCTVSVQPGDGKVFGSSCSVSVNTIAPTPGNLILSGPTTLSKTVINGSVDAIVSGYTNASTDATLTIRPFGLCASSIGTCTFQSNNSTSLSTRTDGTFKINVTLKNNPFGITIGGSRFINVTYSPNGFTSSASFPITDNSPSCGPYSFSTTGPYNGDIRFSFSATDDWSLRSLGQVELLNSSGTAVRSIFPYTASYWPIRSPVTTADDVRIAPTSGTFVINSIPSISDGNYSIRSYIRDNSGKWGSCISTTFNIDDTAPTCVANSTVALYNGNVVSDVTDDSPLTFRSTASDSGNSLRSVTFYVVPNGTPIANIVSNAVYSSTVNAPANSPGTNVTLTSPAPGWISNLASRDIYTVYAQWLDSAGNVPNGQNNCSTNVEIGTRYRVSINLPSDGGFKPARFEDNGNEFQIIANRNGLAWPNLENSTPLQFLGPEVECRAQYPNGNPSDDHGNCPFVLLTDTVFGRNDTSNIAVRVPNTPGNDKYVCSSITVEGTTYNSSQLHMFTHSDGNRYCRINFSLPTTGFQVKPATQPPSVLFGILQNPEDAYPTSVSINLSYNNDAVSGMIFDKNSNLITSRIISSLGKPNGYYFSSTTNHFVMPGLSGSAFDSNLFWASPGDATFSIQEFGDEMCFFSKVTSPSGLPTNQIASLITLIRNRTPGIIYNSDCNINIPLTKGLLSPAYQNQVTILVAPRMYIGASRVEFVPNLDACSSGPVQNFPFGMNATLTEIGAPPVVLGTTNVINGEYNFSTQTLDYSKQYQVRFDLNGAPAGLSLDDFSVCSDSVPRSNPYGFNPIDSNSGSYFNLDNSNYGLNYPNVSSPIVTPIKFYLKESNRWWQVYNGGIHSNDQFIIDSNAAGGDGMPAQAVLVGDPRPLLPNGHSVPKGLDLSAIFTENAPYIAGGLVSAFGIDPSGFDGYGLSDVSGINNWNITDFNSTSNKSLQISESFESIFQIVKQYADNSIRGYQNKTTINGDTLKTNKSYFESTNDETMNSTVNVDNYTNKVITAFVNMNGNELTIRNDIQTSNNNILIIYVNGDVVIDPSVNRLTSVFIFANGTVTVASAGEDADDPLIVSGGLYGSEIIFERNLSDDIAYILQPSTRILFNQGVIGKSKDTDFASEIKESRVFWILKE